MPACNPIWISTNLLPNSRQSHRNLPHAWNCGLFEFAGPQCSSTRNRVIKPLQLSFVFWQGHTGSRVYAQPGQTVVWLNCHPSPAERYWSACRWCLQSGQASSRPAVVTHLSPRIQELWEWVQALDPHASGGMLLNRTLRFQSQRRSCSMLASDFGLWRCF
jgi:hypothetical protein